jgi:hypothetical protein
MSAMNRTTTTLAGRYELLELMGRGGMGSVHRGRDLVLERVVAVKVLPGALAADPSAVARFQREARAAAALNHPGVVAVYDTGVDGDTRFIVMECVAGESLATVLAREGPLDATRAVAIAARMAAALAAAHARGIVHRDVKPSNVMLGHADAVKVLDFGIARALGDAAITRTATVLGTAAYVAPEQGRGEPADERSDCYGLGCVLYEMLAGRPPFTGDAIAAVIHQHVTAEPVGLRARGARVPAALDALALSLLEKDPRRRLGPAGHVHDALAALFPAAGGSATPAPSALPSGAARRPTRSRAVAPPTAATRASRAGAGAALPPPPSTASTRRLGSREPPAAQAGQAHRAPRAIPPAGRRGARRRMPALAALGVLALVAAAIAGLASGSGGTQRRSSSTAHAASRTHRRPPSRASTAARQASSSKATSGVPTPVGPPALAAAATAVDRALATAVAAGQVPPGLASQLSGAVTGLVSGYNAASPLGSLRPLAELVRRTGTLERSGAIDPAAAATLNAALGRLAGALAQGGAGPAGAQDGAPAVAGSPAAPSPDGGLGPGAHHGGHGKAKQDAGGGGGGGDSGD